MTPQIIRLILLLISLYFPCTVFADSLTGTLSVDSILYSGPDKQSAVITTLPGNSEVVIEHRQGSWYRVATQSPARTGWVRSYNVQIEPDTNWLTRLKRVITGSDPAETTTMATIGIRGLGPGDIRKARPDYRELKKLDQYRTGIEEGLQYAASVPLSSNEIAWFDEEAVTDASIEGESAGGLGETLDSAVEGLKGLFGGSGDGE